MRRLANVVLLASLLFACGAPAYARHHHTNSQARAAEKRNKRQAKKLKKQARAHQKAMRQSRP